MKEELNQFEKTRYVLWFLNLKRILLMKSNGCTEKLNDFGGFIRNKARLVAQGRSIEGDFISPPPS